MRDLLFELGVEELPSGAVVSLGESLAKQLVGSFLKAHIQHGDVRFFSTPRRLAVFISDVADCQEAQTVSRRGPSFDVGLDEQGQPLPALKGFAASCGVPVTELTTVETDKGKWWHYESVVSGVETKTLLQGILTESLASLPIAKPMRWGDADIQFVRPVHWALLLLGTEVISCDVLGVKTGRQTYGHRFHHPQSLIVDAPKAYEASLKNAFVIADFARRRQMIVAQIESLATSAGFTAVMPPQLLDEVTAIVEWPVALMAQFEPKFLEVPSEALIASMQMHQKCFALRSSQGDLVPYFITISNIQSQQPEKVVAGNEKVMRARLSDAAFFYEQDRRQSLSAYRASTAKVIFQMKLGTLLDKSERLCTLMKTWAEPLHLVEADALRVAELSKCDLMTGMVGEFPELQGLMGFYYARHDGESEAVARAIDEQYMPRFSKDALPASDLGCALSLADRMDTLVGTFAIGQKPTGMKDPFKLRRHALAVIRLLIALPDAPPLSVLIQQALHTYGNHIEPEAQSMTVLHAFILERLYAYYEGQGISADRVNAVRARQEDVLCDLDSRIKALQVFANRPEASSLSAAGKRVNNVLQQANWKSTQKSVDEGLFQEQAERDLYQRLVHTETVAAEAEAARDYVLMLSELASLRESVDSFFEHVMVMVDLEALKNNRLSLLARLQTLLQSVADISLLEPSRAQ